MFIMRAVLKKLTLVIDHSWCLQSLFSTKLLFFPLELINIFQEILCDYANILFPLKLAFISSCLLVPPRWLSLAAMTSVAF